MKLKFKTPQIQEPKAIVLNKPKDDRAALNKAVDAYSKAVATNADLDAQIKKLTAKKVDLAKLEEDVMFEAQVFYAGELDAKDKEVFIESDEHRLKAGKMGVKREITDKVFIFNKLKKDAFIEAVTIPLKIVDDYLTADEKKKCVTSSDTKRNLSYVGPSEKAKLGD